MRPDDRRVALVALWPQSRSEAKTEGTDGRQKRKQLPNHFFMVLLVMNFSHDQREYTNNM